MLEPGIIPAKEPRLRVGIILPEDGQQTVTLTPSMASATTFSASGSSEIPEPRKITVTIDGPNLQVDIDGTVLNTSKIILLQSDESAHILTETVIAGRGFHWAKMIPVKLPGTLELSNIGGNLLLINELPLEAYLACVATSEMSNACPPAYLQAQTIVARSWMLANVEQKHVDLGADVCNDDCCQRYQGVNNLTESSLKAAEDTRGQVLLYENRICDARYSKSCGGMMESFENLWDGDALPYMKIISDSPEPIVSDLSIEGNAEKWIRDNPECYCSPAFIPEKDLKKYLGHVDEAGEYFRWTVNISNEELSANIRDKLGLDIDRVLELRTEKRGGSGRLLELVIVYRTNSGNTAQHTVYKDYEARKVLHPKFLFSSAVVIEPFGTAGNTPEGFIYRGAGWGHGAGLCQIGGLGMSLAGKNASEIVLHYFPGSSLEKIY